MRNYESDLNHWIDKLEKANPNKEDAIEPLLEENFALLKRHIRKVRNEGRQHRTVINHIDILLRFSRWWKKPYTELTPDDLDDYWDTLKMKEVTKNLHKKLIKNFLKKINPVAISELKIHRVKSTLTPDQLLTDDEVYRLIAAASNARDRALIACLYDSGARIGELLSTTVSDVKFDNYGALLWLRKGKTGPRNARLIFASSYLRHWMEVHPKKNNTGNPLFCSVQQPEKVLSQTGLYEMISTLREKTGIEKRINPHIYRKTKATYLAKKLRSEQKIKAIMGWTPDSTVVSEYITLSATDIDDAVFEAEGIRKEETEAIKPKVYRCKRCNALNAITQERCDICGFSESDPILDNDAIRDIVEMTIAEREAKMLNNPEYMIEHAWEFNFQSQEEFEAYLKKIGYKKRKL